MEQRFSTAVLFLHLLCHTLTLLVPGDAFSIEPTVIVTAGQTATMACGVTVPEDHTVEGVIWYQRGVYIATISKTGNGLSVKIEESQASKFNFTENYGALILHSVVVDSGRYLCKVIMKQLQPGVIVTERNATTTVIVQDVPSPPGPPKVTNILSRQITVEWTLSERINNSPIIKYVVQIRTGNEGSWNEARRVEVMGATVTSSTIQKLAPYSLYQVRITAVNGIGESQPSRNSEQFFTNSEPPSSSPQNLRASSNSSSMVLISWKSPHSSTIHGILQGYEVVYRIEGKQEVHVISVEDPNKTSLVMNGLQPYTDYTISVKAFNEIGTGPEAMTTVLTAEGIPSRPRITHTSNMMSESCTVHWEAPVLPNGHLQSYILEWSHNGTVNRQIISKQLTNPMFSYIHKLKPYTQYQLKVAAKTGGGQGEFSNTFPALTDVAAPSAPELLNLTVVSNLNSVFVEWLQPSQVHRQIDKYFIQWWDTQDSESSDRLIVEGKLNEYIVKGIPPNREYMLKIAGISQSIFSKNYYVGVFTDPVPFKIVDERAVEVEEEERHVVSAGVVAGIVICILIFLIVGLLFVGYKSLACRKFYRTAYNYLSVPTSSQAATTTLVVVAEEPFEEASYPPIPVNEFLQHVKSLHADSDVGFAQEFDDINKHTRVDWKSDNCNLPENRSKNRYINITAFDHSRVILKTPNGRQKHTDYINANYVDGYLRKNAYIATQGPLPQTFADYWRMIWEQNCVVIVMITNLMERGRRKCDMYWPEDGIEEYGMISVKHLNTFSRAHYTVRMFSLKNLKYKKKQYSERIVYQYHYTEWPDHGVPDFTLPVLKFVQKSVAENPPRAGPIVVHCSAGVGRTGTYILIDSMIQEMEDKGTLNVPNFLLHVRKQRNFLVQTEEQYMSVHDALAEYILCSKDTEVRDYALAKYIENLTSQEDEKTQTLLQKQYELVTAFKPKDADKFHALKAANKDKNRNGDTIPLGTKRVVLPAKPGIDGSDYINATYLQGYNKTDEFIVTQHPLESTVEDFWRMVWDQNSSVILLLSHVDEEEYKSFWPEKDSPIEVDTGNFKLIFREEDHKLSFVTRDFLLESTQDDYILMTRIVSTTYWPQSCTPLHTVFELVQTIRKLHQQNDAGPVIVVDRCGGVEAGTFCALMTVYDQLQHDKSLDIYHATKLFHLKRPGVVGTQDDYLFLYKAAESLCHEWAEKESHSPASRHRSSLKKNGTLPRSVTFNSKIETDV